MDASQATTTEREERDLSHLPTPDANQEFELKLLVPAEHFEQVREAPVIVRHRGGAGVVRRLEATYYDTADRTLFLNGLSLRVRRDGRRYTQTLKRAPIHGQPFLRAEWESPVTALAPDLSLLPVGEIGAPLDTLDAGQLRAIFVTKVRRRLMRLDLPSAVVEAAFDDGVIEADKRSERLAEVELELKAGDASALPDLALELLEIAPLRISTLSKSDRGYSLAFDTATKATKAQPAGIAAGNTVDDVIASLLGACQHHLLANQPVAERGGDPEGVHQMRVALRRLRTACALLGREIGSPALMGFAAEAKWLAQLLGGAREWDVLVTDTLRQPLQAIGPGVDFDSLRAAAEPHRLAAYEVLRTTLADARYNRFNLSLRRYIECRGWRNEMASGSLAVLVDPARAMADRLLARLHRQALKRGARFRRMPPEARHRLRITLKKLRYAVEFFRGLYGDGKTKPFVASLAELQDALGHANDAAMTQPLLAVLAADSVKPSLHCAIGAVVGWQARDGAEVDKTLRKHWSHLKALPVFWSE